MDEFQYNCGKQNLTGENYRRVSFCLLVFLMLDLVAVLGTSM